LTVANRASAVNTSRLLASRKVTDAGSLASAGSSLPSAGRSLVRSIRLSSWVLPSRETATLLRSWLRTLSNSRSTSPLPGLSSEAICSSTSASSRRPALLNRRPRPK
jgi:hypothetical protein